MKVPVGFALLCLLVTRNMYAQTDTTGGDSFSPAIEDNSMFIEEAYNQDARVVQHISNFIFLPDFTTNFCYAFTQEWPLHGLKHQLSYSLQYNSLDDGSAQGFGDMMVNYRYQVSYKESFVAFAPRLSVIVPTGNKNKGLGSGSWGLQTNLPFSKRWSNHFVTHFNAGATYLFTVKQPEINFNKPTLSYFVGASAIFLASEKFNLMLECLQNINANPGLNNTVAYSSQTIVAPAFRFAIDFKHLQIVPGFSLPVSLSKGMNPQVGGFFYLSFENDF